MSESVCSLCDRPWKPRCEHGELIYKDGSSRVCPNWNKHLDEIGGMTREEAEDQARFDAQCR
jgi:hypothetical protein